MGGGGATVTSHVPVVSLSSKAVMLKGCEVVPVTDIFYYKSIVNLKQQNQNKSTTNNPIRLELFMI